MKTLKINFLNTPFYAILLTLFMTWLLVSCQEAKTQNTSEQAQKRTVQPEMDLQAAVIQGNLEAVKQHIEAGTDLNAKDPMSGSTALISAITFDKNRIADALIDAGIEVSETDLGEYIIQLKAKDTNGTDSEPFYVQAEIFY